MSASVTTRAVMIAVTPAAGSADTSSAASRAPTVPADPATCLRVAEHMGHTGARRHAASHRPCHPPAPP